jgi:hypothetical protein
MKKLKYFFFTSGGMYLCMRTEKTNRMCVISSNFHTKVSAKAGAHFQKKR